jgi:carbamoyl-phosphate synthase large subunit
LPRIREEKSTVNVLITSASRKVGLVRAFQGALARHGGGAVIAVDVSPFAPALYVADRHALVRPSTDPRFLQEILQFCVRERVRLLVPTRDEELPVFAGALPLFQRNGIRVLVPTLDTLRLCQDKLAFVAFCHSRQFGTPRTFPDDEWKKAELPLFLKPRFGKSATGTATVHTLAELQRIVQNRDNWIIQEVVSCPEYSVDLLADFEGTVLSAVPRLRQLVVAGESYVSRTVREPILIQAAVNLATELHLVGPNTIQCFFDGDSVKFVEVNPRFGGATALGIAAGANTPDVLLRLVGGEKVPPLCEFQSNLVMLRFTEDLFLKSNELASAPRDIPEAKAQSAAINTHSPINAVLFDLDNTLYAEEQFVMSGLRAVAKFLATSHSVDSETLFQKMVHILKTEGRGRIFNKVLHDLGVDSESWLKTVLLEYRTHEPRIALFPGVVDILNSLRQRGMRLGLVTDGPASTQRSKVTSLNLTDIMDVIVYTADLGEGCSKPSTLPFEVALNLLGLTPQTAAYIADDITKDFAGPNRLGMRSVQVCSTGLIGARLNSVPDDSVFRPQLKAVSLADALSKLGVV